MFNYEHPGFIHRLLTEVVNLSDFVPVTGRNSRTFPGLENLLFSSHGGDPECIFRMIKGFYKFENKTTFVISPYQQYFQ